MNSQSTHTERGDNMLLHIIILTFELNHVTLHSAKIVDGHQIETRVHMNTCTLYHLIIIELNINS